MYIHISSTHFILTLISDLSIGDLNSDQFDIVFNLSVNHIVHIIK